MPKEFLYFLYLLFLNKNFLICGNLNDTIESITTTEIYHKFSNQIVNVNETKISGGYRGNSKKLCKYAASIRKIEKERQHFGMGHFCGGAIISRQVILTASHCLFKVISNKHLTSENSYGLSVVVGNVKRTEKSSTTQVLGVRTLILHPSYNPITFHNDIALIILDRNIIIDERNVEIIPLPKEPPTENLRCTAVGWGSIYYKGPKPDEVVYANFVILSEAECYSHYPTKNKKELCAYVPDDKYMDTCQGDSGGPLFCKGAVYGVVSRGIPCGLHEDASGIYTSVYDYLGWIHEKSSASIRSTHYIWFNIILFCMILQ